LPKKALTAAAVKRMKPPSVGQVDYFDQGYPGLALRISYGGTKSFAYFYRVRGGKLQRLSLGTYPALSLADAREAWRAARQEVERGRDPTMARRISASAPTSFSSVAEEWLKRDQAGKRTAGQAKRILEKYAARLNTMVIGDITRPDIREVVRAVADTGHVTMARRVHGRLHRLFAWAVSEDYIAANPMTGLLKLGEEVKRDRVLSDDELVAVWRGCEKLGWPFGPAIRLLILTGARREEIGKLRWSELSSGEISLTGNRTKNGEPHDTPLSTTARGVIADLPCIHGSEFVFTKTGKAGVTGWSTAKARLDKILFGNNGADSEPWRLHDLRRTVATGLQKLGTPLQVTEAVLGHLAGSRAGVVGIYQRHDYADEKRAALESWGAHVMALVEGQKPGKVLPFAGKG
jgi:integrase